MNLLLLSATLLALLSGPLLYRGARDRPALLAFLDGFVLVAISGLVMLEVLPEALAAGGRACLLFLALGALGPTVLEHQLHHARRTHVAALALAMAGLVLHSIGDGTALAPQPAAAGEGHIALALAIAVHSVPVGLMVWWLLFPVFGALLPSLAIGAMCLGTLVGYGYAETVSLWLGAKGWAWLQALVAGSILHVVFGRPHLDAHSAHQPAPPPFEGLGNLAALAGLVVLESLEPASASHRWAFLQTAFELSKRAAPALLLAWLAAGLMQSQPALRVISRWRASTAPDAKAASGKSLFSTGNSAERRDPSPSSSERSLDFSALMLSIPLLGWPFAVLRAVSELLIARLLRLLAARRIARGFAAKPPVYRFSMNPAPAFSLRATAAVPPLPVASTGSFWLVAVDRDLPWLMAGLAIAALATPHLQTPVWLQLPLALQIAAFAVLGVLAINPVAATPLAAVLMQAGLDSGPLLAFVLSGSLLNPPAVLRQMRHSGTPAAIVYSLAALMLVMAAGFAAQLSRGFVAQPLAPDTALVANLQTASLLALALLTAYSLLRRGGRDFFGLIRLDTHTHNHPAHTDAPIRSV